MAQFYFCLGPQLQSGVIQYSFSSKCAKEVVQLQQEVQQTYISATSTAVGQTHTKTWPSQIYCVFIIDTPPYNDTFVTL